MKLTDEELKEIGETVEAATPGPWKYEKGMFDNSDSVFDPTGTYPIAEMSFVNCEKDGPFIANAPTYIKALLAHIEAQAAEKAALTEKLTDRETRLKAGEESYMVLQRKYYLLEQGLCRANLLLEKMEVSP